MENNFSLGEKFRAFINIVRVLKWDDNLSAMLIKKGSYYMERQEYENKIIEIQEDIMYQTGFVDGIKFVLQLEDDKKKSD